MELKPTDVPYMQSLDTTEWSVVHNGDKTLGIKFFVDDEILLVNLPTVKAEMLARTMLKAIQRGRIV